MAVKLPEKLSWHQIEYSENINRIPPDLLPIVALGENVLRFVQKDNPPGIVFDTVARHLIRGDYYLADIGVDKRTRRGWWNHDLAEIVILTRRGIFHDTTAPDKRANKTLDHEIEQTEEEVAAEILLPTDLQLFLEYQAMKGFLKSRHDIQPSFETTIAGLIDTIDGNMCFHSQATESLIAGTTHPESWPHSQLDFTFTWSETVQRRFKELYVPPKRLDILNGLVNLHLNFIQDCWAKVPPDRIPSRVQEHLSRH